VRRHSPKHVTTRDLRLDYGIDEWYGGQEEIRQEEERIELEQRIRRQEGEQQQ
jgi:hypothetical protein